MGGRLAVVGATGYTGTLVVAELLRRGGDVVAVGRNREKLQALPPDVEAQIVDVADAAALRGALDGCRAVVNCVGSFLDHGAAVVDAAVAVSAAYVDTAGEFPFLAQVFELHDAPARQAGVPLVPGVAFYALPADLAAALAARALGRPPDSVEIGYHLAGARPSRGTLRTNLRRAGLPCPVWDAGRLVERRVGDDPRLFRFPEPYGPVTVARWPGGEVLSVPRHTGAGSVAVWVGMPKVVAAVLRNPRFTAPLQRIGGALVGQKTGGPSAEARSRARFAVVVAARAGTDEVRCIVEGHDLYGVTAAACGEAVQRLTTAGEPLSGALAPAEAFDPAGFLDALSSYLTWRLDR
ncbi:MAG: saccharopine dehydrogenase NADP-binding domain-containing protein [Actinobacteria bacterium]|nr:saccharopine dehydrogenase NADP-binding domain-containing protein [Actinomycetota bacterium]